MRSGARDAGSDSECLRTEADLGKLPHSQEYRGGETEAEWPISGGSEVARCIGTPCVEGDVPGVIGSGDWALEDVGVRSSSVEVRSPCECLRPLCRMSESQGKNLVLALTASPRGGLHGSQFQNLSRCQWQSYRFSLSSDTPPCRGPHHVCTRLMGLEQPLAP